ncbi:MAG: helix-turn-helix domain-containing protein [Angustibacter sp.]
MSTDHETSPVAPVSTPIRGGLDPLLLTPEEVAEVLRVGRSKVYDLMRTLQLRSVKIGGSRRIPAAALTMFVQALIDEDAA